MPRVPVVSRTQRVIDVKYKFYDKRDMSVRHDVQRFGDYRMTEKTIMNKIEQLHTDRKVLEVEKISTNKVTYKMPLDEFIKVAEQSI